MRCFVRGASFCALLAGALSIHAQADSNRLPVKRVVLYKNGVGYFEHIGQVQGNEDVTIPFTSGQLNDVLKSLTVLDLGGGRITGVGYASNAPADRRISDLRLPAAERATLAEFLAALRGSRVEIKNGPVTATGRLLSLERKSRSANGAWNEIDVASLLAENGEVRTVELSPGFSVKLLDPSTSGRIGQYLDIVSGGRDPDTRPMVVSTEGAGPRDLFVSYISEVPVWKSTYRIVLGKKEPLLQGWAIVDNTIGQDWKNVSLSLVAGAPQSFIQNLSQPYFTRRPSAPVSESLSQAPQTYEATLITGAGHLQGRIMDPSNTGIGGASVKVMDGSGAILAEAATDANGYYRLTGLPEGPLRLIADAPGFSTSVIEVAAAQSGQGRTQDLRLLIGSSTQTVTVTGQPALLQTSNASVAAKGANLGRGVSLGSGSALGGRGTPGVPSGVGAGMAGGVGGGVFALPAAAAARELGDLFEYKLKSPVTIEKNRSALVPIIQSSIGAEKISVWNDRAGLPRPVRALWLTNSSGLTLDGGSFSVLEDETFAGEGIFDPIRPAEKRIVSYAIDLALNASSRNDSQPQHVIRVRAVQGVMIQEIELRERKTYTFRNEDTSGRCVIVEHPVRAGYQLRSEARPIETTADWMRFRLDVGSKQTAALVVEESRPIENRYQLSNITRDQIDLFVRQQTIDQTAEDALRRILAQKDAIIEIEHKKETREEEMKSIFDDQERLRENIKSLRGSAEEKPLLQRYTGQLNQQETRLEKLRGEIAAIETELSAAQESLDQIIRRIAFDVRL